MSNKKVIAIICGLLAVMLVYSFATAPETDNSDTSSSTYESTVESVFSEDVSESDKSPVVQSTADFIDTEETNNSDKADTTKEKETTTKKSSVGGGTKKPVNTSSVPAYSGKAYVVLNSNVPSFSSKELTTKGYEKYSSLDSLGRCGVVIASLGKDTMPKDGEERGSISSIKPSGWVQAKYDCVSGKYLYNRCHLIGWQLSAENANKRNLITGTKYFNVNGMLPFENMVADYIKETGNHVAYRVTPVYNGKNLVASGVQIEAYSVEDNGEGISFNVYCYNVQPGVKINYATGVSSLSGATETTKKTTTTTKKNTTTTKKSTTTTTKKSTTTTTKKATTPAKSTYILNINSKKIHYSHCGSVKNMKESNKKAYNGDIDTLLDQGYTTCGNCF